MTSSKDLTLLLHTSESEGENVRQVSITLLRLQQLLFKSRERFRSLMSQNSEYMVIRRKI
jgi:hypothetical protein